MSAPSSVHFAQQRREPVSTFGRFVQAARTAGQRAVQFLRDVLLWACLLVLLYIFAALMTGCSGTYEFNYRDAAGREASGRGAYQMDKEGLAK